MNKNKKKRKKQEDEKEKSREGMKVSHGAMKKRENWRVLKEKKWVMVEITPTNIFISYPNYWQSHKDKDREKLFEQIFKKCVNYENRKHMGAIRNNLEKKSRGEQRRICLWVSKICTQAFSLNNSSCDSCHIKTEFFALFLCSLNFWLI